MRAALIRVLLLVVCLAPPAATAALLPRIMIIGDSIQTGSSLRDATSQAAMTLQALGNVIVHDFSCPGARLTDVGFIAGMHQATSAVHLLGGPFGKLDGIVINLGTNDWSGNADLAVFEQDYTGLLASFPPGVRVLCMGPTWSRDEGKPNAGGHTKDDFRAATRRACEGRGIPYIDGRDAIPPGPRYFPDGLHPNDAGHRLMGKWLRDQLAARGWLP